MPFADELISARTSQDLTEVICSVEPGRSLPALEGAEPVIGQLPLRERSDLLRDALLADVGETYASLADTVRRVMSHASFTGWMIWPVTTALSVSAVADGGHAAFDDAMRLLRQLTSRSTAEFAIRALLSHDLGRAMGTIAGQWLESDDEHVRRLASEGTRPYLPWATRVPGILRDPETTVPILNALYRDESEYVRRSVANHLNDLSRDHRALVISTARGWLTDPDENTEGLLTRGLRTLVKKGDHEALAVLGFPPGVASASPLTLDRSHVVIGDSLTFCADVVNESEAPARLAIDYIVHHRKANGSLSAKTFKLAVRTIRPKQVTEVVKTHSFRELTTRRYHPGVHSIELMVNGVPMSRVDFTLATDPASPTQG